MTRSTGGPFAERGSPLRTALASLLLAAATAAAYWHLPGNGFIPLDDLDYVVENITVRRGLTTEGVQWAFLSLEQGNWHPLSWLSHMLDVELFGLRAGLHHITSLVLHVANALLLFFFFHRTTGALRRSWAVAALFALHPLHVESVAWVAERKDVLSTFFCFLALHSYAGYSRRPSLPRYAAVLAWFALGLASKPMLVTFPFLLLLLDLWPLGRFRPWDSHRSGDAKPSPLLLVAEKAPLFLLSALSSVVTMVAQQRGAAVASLDALPLAVRVPSALAAYGAYILKTLWPSGLSIIYPHPGVAPPLWQTAAVGAFLFAVTAASFASARRRPWLTTGWLWYLGTLVPVIGLVQVGAQFMADRYTYLPLVGLFVIFAWGGEEILRALRLPSAARTAAAMVVILPLGLVTARQAALWRDGGTLFTYALEVKEDNWLAMNFLGSFLYQEGDEEEAVPLYREALRLRPSFTDAHYNLGIALEKLGDLDGAEEHLRQALGSWPGRAEAMNTLGSVLARKGDRRGAELFFREALAQNPSLSRAAYNLGLMAAEEGRLEEALEHLAEAEEISPDRPEIPHQRGLILVRLGRPEEGAASFRSALKIDGTLASAHYNLALTLQGLGRSEEALDHYRRAVFLDPGDAASRTNLGILLADLGRSEEALTQFEEALRIDPGNSEGHYNLARYLEHLGRRTEAIDRYREALRLDPGSAAVHNNLGVALAEEGRLDEAEEKFERALELNGDYPEARANLERIRSLHRRR